MSNGEHKPSHFFVPPLSIQREGENCIIGDKALDEFYSFPIEAALIVEELQQGTSIQDIQDILNSKYEDDIDLNDFIELLQEIGFIYPVDQAHLYHEKLNQNADNEKRLSIEVSPKFARKIVSPVGALLYGIPIAFACYLFFSTPVQPFNLTALHFTENFTVTLFALLGLYLIATLFHETGHVLAAASQGVSAKLGIGNRLWSIVLEADISGLMSLPKSARYFPLFAGMMMDILTISLATITLHFLLTAGSFPYLEQLIQAFILQILFTMSWQFNIFLRTDVYYAFSNYFDYPNLDEEARIYLKDKFHICTFGLVGKPAKTSFYNKNVLAYFSLIWLFGRVIAVFFLIFVVIPTVYRYFEDIYTAFAAKEVSQSTTLDLILFGSISTLILVAGLVMWMRERIKRHQKELES
ncbi:PqqD family protein [Aestuariibacter sp. AA17]|uniref:PqqD family protein n=1 Tax=Fluctibacter corallii TaxID=2984329 RepID=A0ABT3A4J0_9ALTE|nr:PqqD family protein [Aestuariibacter sp. AA17]MCV2883608.1 PqqD family protein [Aestuariibacter sp. AA17]